MATFHPFPRLPPELRALVWRLTVEPRIVEVYLTALRELPDSDFPLMRLASSTLVPAALQTCREARSLGLYQRELSEVPPALRTAAGKIVPHDPSPQEQLPSFWLNWDIDVLSVGTTPLSLFLPIAPLVKRLRLARRDGVEQFLPSEGHHLDAFVGVEEIQIVCLGQLWDWEEATGEYLWPCGPDNLFLIETVDGTMMRAAELDAMLAGLREEEQRQRVEGGPQDVDPDISDAELDALLASRREEEARQRSAGSYGYEFS